MKKLAAVFISALVAVNIATNISFAAFDSAEFNEPKNLEILRITPEGNEAETGSQIVIEFNRPVVPVGEMERKSSQIPVEITPSLNCQWRWLNASALACNLNESSSLKEATKYKVIVKPGIKAEDGKTIAGEYTHEFTTKLPDVYYAYFSNWEKPGVPVYRVLFNQSVTVSSVENSIYFMEASTEKKYEIEVFAEYPEQKADDVAGKKGRSVWMVKPTEEISPNVEVQLRVKPGLVGIVGKEVGNTDHQVTNFYTHPAFEFLGLKCYTNDNKEVFIKPGEKVTDLCNPLGSIALAFSGPVKDKDVRDNIEVLNSKGKDIFEYVKPVSSEETEEGVEEESDNEYMLRTAYRPDLTYNIWLPDLTAASTYKVQVKEPEFNWFEQIWRFIKSIFSVQPDTRLEDMFGRPLMKGSIITFQTDNRAPNFVIANDPAVLESGIDSDVPLYIQNIDSAEFTYKKMGGGKQVHKYSIPNVRNIQFAIPFEIRKMLGGKSGALYGNLTTKPLVNSSSGLFAEVTPYQVHAKIGHFNSFIWVTDFATGKAVDGAKVTIYKDKITDLRGGSALAASVTDNAGVAVLKGMDELDPQLTLAYNYENNAEKLFVKVEKNGEIALLPIKSDFESYNYSSGEDYGAYPYQQQKYGHIKSWGTTAQGVYHAGDTIQYKIYVRNQDAKTLVPAPKGTYKLEITDPTENVVSTVENIQLNEFGAIDGEYKTSQNSKVGWYGFRLTADFNPTMTWYPARVLVSDFTPSPFKVSNQLNGTIFKKDEQIKVESFAKLHSGGPYTNATVRVTGILSQKPFVPESPALRGYSFNSYTDYADQSQVFEKQEKLDDKGEFETSFKVEGQKIYYGNLMVETAVQDDRGKFYAGSSNASYAGVDRFIGLKSSSWMYEKGKPVDINYIVVDEKGVPIKGAKAEILFEQEVITAAKVKGAGNAYIPEYKTTWKKAGGCVERTEITEMRCSFTPQKSGYYRASGMVRDTDDKEHKTELGLYVSGSDYVMWNESSDSSLTIVPEKSSYKVGETAKYLVKNPYPGALALITVERYGVIDHFVKTLNDSAAIIELPIKPDYLPGFYMSVTVFSPRVDKPIKDQVDLGKPAFRAGYITVPVNDTYKQMVVTAETDKKEYRPREIVTLNLKAQPKTASKKEPIEFAVVVLDEAVLDLIAGGKDYYDPYSGLYSLDSLDVKNFSLLTRLVGRQKFEKKGANPGGDGGANLSMRNIFKYVSYWNPSLKADSNGEASVDFTLPDNLTGWRVLAIATTPTDRVGMGDLNFKTNKKTEILTAMPNQVTEGDSFDAAFTIMNRTDKAREVEVKIVTNKTLLTKKVKLEPFKRELVKTPIITKVAGELEFKVYASDKIDKDAITHKLKINKRRSLETGATYGTTEKDAVQESLQIPKNIYPDVGSISIVTSPTVIGNVDGAFEYMRDYPYMCWEQKMTKAVMASHYQKLSGYMNLKWNEATSLPQDTLDIAAEYQAPNGGMAYFLAEDSRVDPYLSAYTALSFNWLKAAGYKVPQNVENKLHEYLLNFLRNDSAPEYYSEGMRDSIRAVALNALATNGKAGLPELERYQSHFKNMSLFGKTNYLQAAVSTPGASKFAEDSAKNILTYANQSGGKFTFTEKLDDGYERILSSELRENCAILSAFTQYGEREGSSLVGDIPFKLTRMITQSRGKRAYWENTQENLFCMNALIDYARIYESTKPDMNVTLKLDGTQVGAAKFIDFKDKAITTEKSIAAVDIGKKKLLDIVREGDGRLYYSARVSYAPKAENDKYTNAGIEVERKYSIQKNGKFEPMKAPFNIKQGDLVKVDIYIKIPAARNFVVVDDPIPGGLEPVNRELANASTIDADKAEANDFGGYYSFYHKELRHDRAIFYSDYLEPGVHHVSYTAQAIASGKFTVMPIKAEEMYDPDVYGKGVSESLAISQ